MSNIFKSSEIYKRLPKVSSKENPLRTVRGIYVAGAYKAPHYIDGCIHVSEISSTKALVKPFGTVNETINDYLLNIKSIEIDRFKITDYSKRSCDIKPDNVINISNISIEPPEITCYVKTDKSLVDENVIHVSDVVAIKPTYTQCLNHEQKLNPEPAINLLDVSSIQATITKGV